MLTGFTGYTWDVVLEVHFAQARLYDPIAKRFMQTDPIGGRVRSPMSINPYLYCRNDPVNYIDPTGMAMPDDYLLFLTAEEVAQIEQYSIAWFAAEGQTNQDDLQAAAHKAAEAIRDVA
ncbi:MAG: RHS repeat-associated core domain-containing protein, partial [Oscillospiraceae bacterium]|nr:RHS repeat-associated core domain-containing protein [Oscillospiraceae bacterium]